MDDRHAVGRQVNVELEPIGAGGAAEIESGHRVLRTERAAAAVREHERTGMVEEGQRLKVAWSLGRWVATQQPSHRATQGRIVPCSNPQRSPRWANCGTPSKAARSRIATSTRRCDRISYASCALAKHSFPASSATTIPSFRN